MTRPAPFPVDALLSWYAEHARDLPWRRPAAGPWAVLVSELMLHQTPVARVLPVYATWLRRWPTPTDLAAGSRADALRAWGKLGYPRRALRLHETAVIIAVRYAGQVPTELDDLLKLPGVGGYTARAVATFAFGQRQAVVDTNVRRLISRAVLGRADSPGTSTKSDLAMVEPLVPADPALAARFAAAAMELGALVCTSRAPACSACPLRQCCEWKRSGYPPHAAMPRRVQGFVGTDRQVRGLLLDVLRKSPDPVPADTLDAVWPDHRQCDRARASLIADGLLVALADGCYALPD